MNNITWLWLIAAVMVLAVVLYWQLVIAEGAYLGQRMVTWLYDLTASRYDQIKQYQPAMETLFLGAPLARALRSLPAPLVLDVATGTARLPLALFKQPAFQGYVIGLDDSLRMLDRAAQKTADSSGRFHLLWCDAANLPFDDDIFDALSCLEMLEFTPDPARQIAEMVRVLRPGGLFLTTRRIGFDARLMPGKTHSEKEFEDILAQHHLTNIRIERWQMDYDLVWATKEGQSLYTGIHNLAEILRCPVCVRTGFAINGTYAQCLHCEATFSFQNQILHLK